MASIRFYLKEPNSNDPTLLMMTFAFEGKRFKFSAKDKIHPDYWNNKEQLVRRSYNGYAEFNDSLMKLREDYQKAYRTLKSTGERITLESLRRVVNEANGLAQQTEKNLMGFIESYIEKSSTKVTHGTIKSYKTTEMVLKRFQKHKNKRIDFPDITMNFYDDYLHFMRSRLDYANNTVGKHVKNLKVFMKEATDRGYNKNMDFLKKGFKVPKEEIDNIYLNEEELDKISKLDLSSNERMDFARDLFLVGCWLGLRFGDYSQIKKENIKNGFITIRTEKTNELVSIPVNSVVEKIMNKYKGRFENSLPPAFANQVMNKYLKEIGKAAELTEDVIIKKTLGGKKRSETFKKYELITTHTARRSFATNLFKQKFPSQLIMRLTGHRSERNFLNYLKIKPIETAEELKLHWERIERERLEREKAEKERLEQEKKKRKKKKGGEK